MKTRSACLLSGLCLLLGGFSASQAGQIDASNGSNFSSAGTYTSESGTVSHSASGSYQDGMDVTFLSPSQEVRNYTIFDLSSAVFDSMTESVISATLRLFGPAGSYMSPDASETLQIAQVTTSISDLAGGTGTLSNTFTDLGDIAYGTAAVTGDGWVDILLNSTALTDIAAALGSGSIAFGSSVTTLTVAGNADELIFVGSASSSDPRAGEAFTNRPQLTIVTEQNSTTPPGTVPAPGALLLLSFGLFGLGIVKRRQRIV
ncbi:MAG: PEP-CTERM sorting domain-containing protein [Gammaproteobacteria bacterium]|nr:PEP-CTERM sorting domain-containing protein [Gammaproteobacteria bacterium]